MNQEKIRGIDDVVYDLHHLNIGTSIINALETEGLAILARDLGATLESLKTQLKVNADSADKLTKKVVWLDRVLTAATIIGAFATLKMAFPKLLSFLF